MITKEDIKLIQKLKSEERGKKSTQSYMYNILEGVRGPKRN